MPVTASVLESLIDSELARVTDARVVRYVRGMLVRPHAVLRNFEYGDPRPQYPCWFVLRDPKSGAEIAYCEYGFGPRCPWGLLSSDEKDTGMGADYMWYPTFLNAFFESFASLELPVWKVFRVEADGTRTALTEDGAWDATWQRISELRARDPVGRYEHDHGEVFSK